MAVALLCGMSSCNEKWEIPNEEITDKGYGTLSTEDMVVDVTNAEKVIQSRADVDLSNYIITVTNKTTGEPVAKWIYSEMPGLPTFEAGNYSIIVESMKLQACAWDAPYFVGSKDFEIVKNQITKVGTITCKLQNLKVTVVFEDDLINASAGDLKCVVSTLSNGKEGDGLTFTPETVSAGYFELLPGNISMIAEFSGTVNGYGENFVETFSDINVGEHHIITFKLRESDWNLGDPTGGINLGSINVDMSVVNRDMTGNIIGSEDPLTPQNPHPGEENWGDEPTPPGPDVPTPGDAKIEFSSEYLDLKDGNKNLSTRFGTEEWGDDLLPAVVVITAENCVQDLEVDIKSETLDVSEVGLANHFNLAEPGTLEEALKGLGFDVGDEVRGKQTATFDISGFIPLLVSFDGPQVFTITVTDKKGQSKSLVLTFENK